MEDVVPMGKEAQMDLGFLNTRTRACELANPRGYCILWHSKEIVTFSRCANNKKLLCKELGITTRFCYWCEI